MTNINNEDLKLIILITMELKLKIIIHDKIIDIYNNYFKIIPNVIFN